MKILRNIHQLFDKHVLKVPRYYFGTVYVSAIQIVGKYDKLTLCVLYC